MSGLASSAEPTPLLKDLVSQLATSTGNGAWDEVATVARTLRRAFPLEPLGYVRGALALRQLRRYDEADAVILDAILLFPGDPLPLIEACRVAQGRADWGGAVRRASSLIERFPSQPSGYLIQAHGYRCLKEFSQAERMLAEGSARFPDLPEFGAEACWSAYGQENWALAIERCASLRSAHPTAQAGYQIAAAALTASRRWVEAREVLASAEANFGPCDWVVTESLRLAQQHEPPEKVVELAEHFAARAPSNASAYYIGASAYRRLGRLDDAERLLLRALSTLAPHAQLQAEYACVAQDRGDWVEAERRWMDAKRLFPQDPTVALWHARLPVAAGRLIRKADVQEAHQRFEVLHEQYPDLAIAYADHIRMFRTANCLSEAEDLGTRACSRLPADASIRLEYSLVANDQGRPEEALARLAEVADRFRDDVGFQCRLVAALARAGRSEDAETVCSGLLARDGGSVQPHIEFAELAMRRHDWKTAAERWSAADRRFPGLAWIKRRQFEAQLAVTETGRNEVAGEAAADARSNAGDAVPGELSMQQIVAQFESLAGTFQGCEFGRIQRYFGCEPLGLFRWAQIDIEDLIDAVEARFEGLGTAEQTELDLFDRDEGGFNQNVGFNEHIAEYQVGDTRYRMRMHTFIRRDEMPHDKMFGQSLRRLQFLKRKLLEDLAEARKIFLYKRGHRHLEVDDARRLSQALRKHSADNKLLCVYLATHDHPAGTVERITPHLLFGYVSHFSLGTDLQLRVPAYSEWASVCRSACALSK